MIAEEMQECGQLEPTSLDRRGEAGHHQKRSTGSAGRTAGREAQARQAGGEAGGRDHPLAGSGGRIWRRESEAEKAALAITPHRRYGAEEERLILKAVRQAQERRGE